MNWIVTLSLVQYKCEFCYTGYIWLLRPDGHSRHVVLYFQPYGMNTWPTGFYFFGLPVSAFQFWPSSFGLPTLPHSKLLFKEKSNWLRNLKFLFTQPLPTISTHCMGKYSPDLNIGLECRTSPILEWWKPVQFIDVWFLVAISISSYSQPFGMAQMWWNTLSFWGFLFMLQFLFWEHS